MKKLVTVYTLIALVAVAYSCKKSAEKPTAAAYLDLPATPYVYGVSNADTAYNKKATLGRVLFYDTHLSLNNAISCGSCHKQALGFADNAAFSVGYEGRLTKRNSKSISNLANTALFFSGGGNIKPLIGMGGSPLFWDGRENVLQNLIARPITNHVEMGIADTNVLPGKLSAISYYSALFAGAYGDNSISMERISECVSIFLISIQSNHSRFDEFSQGNQAALSALEMQGYNLFTTKYNCENCHHIFQNAYSTEDFRDIGLDNNPADKGRGEVTSSSLDNGKFRVPSLHNVGLSAPYMHDGRYKTLGDVIDHYSNGIQNSQNLDFLLRDSTGHAARQMNITSLDKQALVAFLNSMTDYSLITDPKFSNPFKLK